MTNTQDAEGVTTNGAVPDRKQLRRVYLASLVGTTVEFYDFIVFGVAASLVFGPVFFDSASPAVGTIASFAILAIGYAARPLGGIIFGHFGDKAGRKSTLMWTMGLMGASTVAIGLLPSSAQIGGWAPILLVVLRLVQGIAVGGEWGGAVMMAVEHAPAKRRGFFGGAASLGSGAGVLLAYLVFGLMSNLNDESFESWGWRVPFLLSIVVVGVGFFVRLRVEESPVFEAEQKQKSSTPSKSRIPLVQVLSEKPTTVLLGIGMCSGAFMAQAILTTTVISYATSTYEVSRSMMLSLLNVALVIMLFTIPLFSWLGDTVGRRTVYIPSVILFGVFSFAMFPLFGTGSTPVILFTFVVGMAVLNAATTANGGTLLSEQFPTKFRYTGAGVAYQFAGLIGGGIGPLLASVFIAPGGLGPIAVSVMIGFFCALSALCVFLASDRGDTFLSDI
ncbi:MFS transporter [Rhodococcus sp. 06-156-3C]|uniref:MFS transporter n=1 Tax=Nocardiaceae TaxID=85025 RepID=UPI00068CC4CB|nr:MULTISPECIES: MFS transporter [Rhodococcus]OZD12576.1 MFS transporter [Rhodococcus sp. 06-156-4a]OZD18015.1 MFS transporter [Rhodococcus sp. 06-156-3C]OZD20425.1 MFS transporter [Rhodococcus sp. 06-156-4C]OZD29269.1 MFS transporter [Rhodococcus sp. 06-156-3]OZD30541.1 MFS transporter [Rhodococcus sp. 06-156-3b]